VEDLKFFCPDTRPPQFQLAFASTALWYFQQSRARSSVDRAPVFSTGGRWFESSRARQLSRISIEHPPPDQCVTRQRAWDQRSQRVPDPPRIRYRDLPIMMPKHHVALAGVGVCVSERTDTRSITRPVRGVPKPLKERTASNRHENPHQAVALEAIPNRPPSPLGGHPGIEEKGETGQRN